MVVLLYLPSDCRVHAYDKDASQDNRKLRYWIPQPIYSSLGARIFSIEADTGIMQVQHTLDQKLLDGIMEEEDNDDRKGC